MKPPYEITSSILKLVSSISEKIGEVNAVHFNRPTTELRKKNRIKTIQSSLEIEGNTLSVEQITALINEKRVIAPQKDILEVQNAIHVYDQIRGFNFTSIGDFKKVHKSLMKSLIKSPGNFRTTGVGIMKGSEVTHMAPSGDMVNGLMKDLFQYLKDDTELLLIRSCVFHYELEFIHPFLDGNGRMGRFWQTLILMEEYPVFEFLPIETIIKEKQEEYYKSLMLSDKTGQSTIFIEFMLSVIEEGLEELLQSQNVTLTSVDRIELYKDIVDDKEFSRQDYLRYFKAISAPTASRDLKEAVEKKMLLKIGDKRTTKYQFKSS